MSVSLTVSANERRRTAEVSELFRAGDPGPLVERLSDPSWAVRRAVVGALARLGTPAVVPLCEVVTHRRDHEGRLAAVVDTLVASLGEVDPSVLPLLESNETAVVCDAAQILGRRKCRAALSRLGELAESADDNVALAAIEAVGRIGGEEAVDLLIAAVESQKFFRAFPAIDVLGRTGDPRAVAPLAALLAAPQYSIEAARALGRTGQPIALAPLTALLVKPSDAHVRVAASALVEIFDRYSERFGPNHVVADALATVDVNVANRGISHALVGADGAERASLCRILGFLGAAGAVPVLVELLDGEPEAAQAAASALSSLRSEADPFLLAALRDSGSERRRLLLPIIGRRASATQDVLACLTDENPAVRALACDALGKSGKPGTVGPLFALLGDKDARVSQAAAAAIQALGGNETERLALVAARSSNTSERRSALRILAYFGWPSALDVFLAGIEDSDERLRDVAAVGLASIDDERSIASLIMAAGHASSRTRAAAVRALGYTRRDSAVRDCVRHALADDDAWVRYYACQALSRLKDDASAQAIADIIEDPAGHVRVAVIEALTHLQGDRSLEALHTAAQSPDCDLRRAALLGLGAVKNASSLPYLQASMQSTDAATRLVALSALAEFDGKDPVASIGAALTDSDEGVRGAAISLLATRPGLEATRALIDHLGDPSIHERVLAALSRPADGRVAALLAALRTASAELAPMLVSALARMRQAEALAGLEDAFSFDNVFARRAVAPALAALGAPSSRRLLEKAVEDDVDQLVRRVSAAYLGSG